MNGTDYAKQRVPDNRLPPDLRHQIRLLVATAYSDGHMDGVRWGTQRMGELLTEMRGAKDDLDVLSGGEGNG